MALYALRSPASASASSIAPARQQALIAEFNLSTFGVIHIRINIYTIDTNTRHLHGQVWLHACAFHALHDCQGLPVLLGAGLHRRGEHHLVRAHTHAIHLVQICQSTLICLSLGAAMHEGAKGVHVRSQILVRSEVIEELLRQIEVADIASSPYHVVESHQIRLKSYPRI